MEPSNPMPPEIESPGEDIMLIETVKSMVTHEGRNESEDADEDFFLMTQDQAVQYPEENVEETVSPTEVTLTWMHLCRICANSSDHMVPIFEGEGAEHDLSSKILKYLPIHVSESDTLPLQLCENCANILITWHELSEGCLSVERKLLEMQDTQLRNKQQYYNPTSLDNLEITTPMLTTASTTVASNITNSLPNQQDEDKNEAHDAEKLNKSNRCELAEERSFATYRSSYSAAPWTNNATIKYESNPMRSMTLIAENAKEISERETRESSDNCDAAKHDGNVDLNPSRYQGNSESIIPQSTSKSVKKSYTCDNCRRVFKRKHHLIRHMTDCKHHDSASEDLSRTKMTKKKKQTDDSTVKEKDRLESLKSTSDDEEPCLSVGKSLRKRSRIYPCGYCEHTAEKRKLLKAHLTETHPEVAKRNRKSFVATETVLRARMEHDGKVYYHCNECGKNLNSPYTFYWHLRIHTGERLFTCHLCGKRFRVNQGLARHLKETHAGIKNVPCDLCGRMFSTRRNVEDHRRIHTGERPYVCNVCGKTFKQKASLFVHNRTHTDVFPFKCSHCGQTFRTRPPLMLHITKHTGEKPHACDVCGRRFRIKLKNQIVIHDRIIIHSYSRRAYKKTEDRKKIKLIQTKTSNMIDGDSESSSPPANNIDNNKSTDHLSPLNISSKITSLNKLTNDTKSKNAEDKDSNLASQTRVSCTKGTEATRYTRQEDAKVNESIECLQKNVKGSKAKKTACTNPAMVCKFCNKKFRSRKSHWAHIRTHSDEKLYTCHICGKQFIQGGSLYYHLKHVHDGVKNHTCDICGRSFAMKTTMEDHRRIHTGERPYVCHTCGKTFKTKASLYIHSKIHTDEFPYRCTYCAKRFRWKQQMLGHLTVHTGEKNHTCDMCGKAFGVKNDLTRHKRVHSEEKPYTCQQCGISFAQKRYLKSHERLKLGMCKHSQSSNRIESD